MRELSVPELHHNKPISIESAELLIKNLERGYGIETINWKSFPHKPDVLFKIAHCQNNIILHYEINQDFVRAVETKTNGNVYKDSCVEFFISLQKDSTYYNFEFSCIGTAHLGYGQSSKNRVLIPPAIVNHIKLRSSLGDKPIRGRTKKENWEITLLIPAECFIHDPGLILKGLEATTNFYKCGDETKSAHFLSWNPISSEYPDFHRPEYFGKINFQ